MNSFKRSLVSYIIGFLFSPLLAMLYGASTKAMVVAIGILSALVLVAIGIAVTQRKPINILLYCWGLMTGIGTYGPFFAKNP